MTTDREPTIPLSADSESTALSHEEVAVVRAAFKSMKSGTQPTIEQLTGDCGLDHRVVRNALDAFIRSGRADYTTDGCLTGIVGLTVEPTRHRLTLEGTPMFTWCAFDAVGIPAALRVDTKTRTTCGYCQEPIEVDIVAGSISSTLPIRGWLAQPESCENVKAEFCPEANLFCNQDHLAAWRTAAGMPEGVVKDLDAWADLGRRSWGKRLHKVSRYVELGHEYHRHACASTFTQTNSDRPRDRGAVV